MEVVNRLQERRDQAIVKRISQFETLGKDLHDRLTHVFRQRIHAITPALFRVVQGNVGSPHQILRRFTEGRCQRYANRRLNP